MTVVLWFRKSRWPFFALHFEENVRIKLLLWNNSESYWRRHKSGQLHIFRVNGFRTPGKNLPYVCAQLLGWFRPSVCFGCRHCNVTDAEVRLRDSKFCALLNLITLGVTNKCSVRSLEKYVVAGAMQSISVHIGHSRPRQSWETSPVAAARPECQRVEMMSTIKIAWK